MQNYLKFLLAILVMGCAASSKAQDSTTVKSEKKLQEVVVKGSAIHQSGDKTSIFITKDMRRGKSTVGEMLSDLPNFYYNRAFGTVSYNNTESIVVLVDSIEKPKETIFNMQHIRYDRLEVIYKPAGKYQGYEVLINFHTKKDYEGYEGYYLHNNGFCFNDYNDKRLIFDNEDASFVYTKNKFTLSANGTFYAGIGASDTWYEQYYKMNGIRDSVVANPDGSRNSEFKEMQTNGTVSMDYMIDKHRSFSALYNYNNNGHEQDNNHTLVRKYDAPDWEDVTLMQRNFKESIGHNHSVGLFYRDYGHRITYDMDLNYRFSPSTSHHTTDETTGFKLDNNFRDTNHFMRYRLSGWTRVLKERMSVGAGYEYTWKTYNRQDRNTHAELNENSYFRNKLWASQTYTFPNDMRFRLTAWAEQIHLKSGNKTDNQLPVGGNMMFYTKLNKKNWLRLNYDCGVEYPDRSLSSNYGYFTDSLSYVGGNPWLKSSVTHNFSLWLDLWECFNFQSGYTLSPNRFCNITELRTGQLPSGENGNYAAYIPQNTRYKGWWASVFYFKRFAKDFTYRAQLKYFNNRASYMGESTWGDGLTGYTSLNYYCRPWSTNFYFEYRYSREMGLTPQRKHVGNFEFPTLAIQKTFLKNHMDVQLTWSGMFHFFNSDTNTTEDNKVVYYHSLDKTFDRQKNRLVLKVVYRFAGGKSVRQYNKEMASEQ